MKRGRKKQTKEQAKRKVLERRRLKAGRWFKEGKSQYKIAKKLGVSFEAVSKWYENWKREGMAGLKSKGKPGRKARLTKEKRKEVEKALLKGPKAFGYATDIWTLKRIAKVIKEIAKVSYHPAWVWYVLKGMGWSCQKPERVPDRRDEKEIRNWKRTTWDEIKKKQPESGL